MSIPDLINGLFGAAGSVAIWLCVVKLLKDKEVRGYSMWTTVFFTAWGYWNLYYYPHLGQWLSFVGGCSIVAANTIWVGLALYYQRRYTRVGF